MYVYLEETSYFIQDLLIQRGGAQHCNVMSSSKVVLQQLKPFFFQI